MWIYQSNWKGKSNYGREYDSTVSINASTAMRDTLGSISTPPPSSISHLPGCANQAPLLSIRMLDQFHGWALNVNAILKTSDGGEHWNCVTPSNFTNKIGEAAKGTFFVDNVHAWVVLTPQLNNLITILRTSDGGQHWQESTINISFPEVIDQPHFINVKEGWLEVVTNGGPGRGSESFD